MAYDKETYDSIQSMQFGDLVHFMLSEYRELAIPDNSAPYMQSTEYFWAFERLNVLTPLLEEADTDSPDISE